MNIHASKSILVDSMPTALTDQDQSKNLEKTSQEFESLFLEMFLKKMRDTIVKTKLIDGGQAEAIYTDFLDGEYAKIMAESNYTGLQQNILKQLGQSRYKES